MAMMMISFAKKKHNCHDQDFRSIHLLFQVFLLLLSHHGSNGLRLTQTIHGERRNIVFSSRHLEGYCLPLCESPEPTTKPPVSVLEVPPTKSPTATTTPTTRAPTKIPTTIPTKSPTMPPTRAPTTRAPITAAPSISISDSPTLPLSPRGYTPVEECPYVSLDFQNLKAGTYIHDELWYSHGVKITARRKSTTKGFTPIHGVHVESGGGAMVFDTSKPTGNTGQDALCTGNDGDIDLGSPNEACGGPGVGEGGAPTIVTTTNGSEGTIMEEVNNPFQNCEPLGNVLIIQESDKSCPDDSANGGFLDFEFWSPTQVQLAKLLDIDSNERPPEIHIWQDDVHTRTLVTTVTGENGVWNQIIDLPRVTKISLELFGSGSIAEIVYRFCPPPKQCPLIHLDFNDLVPGTYIHDEYWNSKQGVLITARKTGKKGFTPIHGIHRAAGGGAMVFDTTQPTGEDGQVLCEAGDGDDDLGTPNIDCGNGPGIGAGGAQYLPDGSLNPYRNCESLGNVLVIQESDKTCPDDSYTGGWIIFDFRQASSVQLAKLLDVDEGNTPEIDITYGNDGKTTMIKTVSTGNNGVLFQPILLDNVTQISIRFFGSGSIAELVYSMCP